jgi:hypothetical protein
MGRVVYITYATGEKYLKKAENILPDVSKYFDEVLLYKKEDIIENFYVKNKKILECERGAGYWLWKPYFILKTLKNLEENDIVFYLDLGDRLFNDIKNFIINKTSVNEGFFLVEGSHNHSIWTKKDCFHLMGCDSNEYTKARQLEAGCCAFTKNDKSIKFVEEWLKFCENYDIISNESKLPNVNGFREHRFDQSILTNLKIKHNIKTVSINEVCGYVNFNEFF